MSLWWLKFEHLFQTLTRIRLFHLRHVFGRAFGQEVHFDAQRAAPSQPLQRPPGSLNQPSSGDYDSSGIGPR